MVNAKTKVSNTTFMGSMRLNLFIGNYSALKGTLVNRSRYVVGMKKPLIRGAILNGFMVLSVESPPNGSDHH